MKIRSDRTAVVDEREPLVTSGPTFVGEHSVEVPARAVVVEQPAVGNETVLTSRTTSFEPAPIVASVGAIALLLLGGITAARAGFDGGIADPVVTVAGYTATAWLALIELGFGLVLLIAALTRSHSAILFLGIAGGVAALVAVFQPSVGGDSLAIEREFALVGDHQPKHAFDKCGFPGAVGTDQEHRLAALHRHAHVIQSAQAAEGFGEVPGVEHGGGFF